MHLIVGDEITIIGSFSETYKFPAAINYLDSGKVKVKGIVNKVCVTEYMSATLCLFIFCRPSPSTNGKNA